MISPVPEAAGKRLRHEGRAVGCSSGIIIGRVKKLARGRQPIPEYCVTDDQVEGELNRLNAAIDTTRQEIDVECEHLRLAEVHDPLMILEAHRMLIVDPELLLRVSDRIRQEKINAEWALRQELDRILKAFDKVNDDYLRNRQDDVEQAGRRIMAHLLGQAGNQDEKMDACVPDHARDPVVYVACDFSVSDIVGMWRSGAAAFVSEKGGADSHAIIVARGIGLPALVGAADILDDLEDGDQIIVDAELGIWIANPGRNEQSSYAEYIEDFYLAQLELQAYACRPSLSQDGRALKLMANIEFVDELDMADHIGIDGVGLYRTEFLFFNGESLPDEEHQYLKYVELVHRMQGKPVTFRLLDAGGDKQWLYQTLTGHAYLGANPAMGLRGIRLLMRSPQLLKAQVRAILRAGEVGPVGILVPMVTHASEVALVRALAEECRAELGLKQPASIGSMIEVPAAAFIARELAEVSNFFSIGTNDLMQYTLASDRSDDDVAKLYLSRHPAVQQLIAMAAVAAKEAGIPMTVCGELASNPEWTETFLNLNIDCLSMSLSKVLYIRRELSRLRYQSLL